MQAGSAAATTLFDEVGPIGAVLLRLLFAAVVLVAVWRPSRPTADGQGGLLVVAFGVTLAAMNLCFYEAIDRIPLGIAVTFEFVGPLAVGLAATRRPRDLLWVGLAAGGVLLLTQPSGSATADGIAFALAAGACWAGYILLSARIGRAFPGGSGLALAMIVASGLVLVPGVLTGGADLLDPSIIGIGLAAALLSSVIPYSLELEALRRIAVGTFGVLMSLEPAAAALIGLVALGQDLDALEWAGIASVMLASARVLGVAEQPPTEA